MNKAIVIGHLARDPELKWVSKDNCVVRFQLATNEKFTKNGEKVERRDFHTFSAWGKIAEVIAKWAKKGDLMYAEGKLRNNNYTNKEGGKVYGYEILVENFRFLNSKKDKEEKDAMPEDADQNQQNNQQSDEDEYSPPMKSAGNGKPNEDDIPF